MKPRSVPISTSILFLPKVNNDYTIQAIYEIALQICGEAGMLFFCENILSPTFQCDFDVFIEKHILPYWQVVIWTDFFFHEHMILISGRFKSCIL